MKANGLTDAIVRPKGRASGGIKSIYAFAMVILLLRYLLLMFYSDDYYLTPTWIIIIQMVMAATGVVLGKSWKDKNFLLLLCYLLFLFFRIVLDDQSHLQEPKVYQALFLSAWAICSCYSFGRIYQEEEIKAVLKVLVRAWTVLSVIHCGIALYAAWNGKVVWNLSHGAFWGLGGDQGAGAQGYAEVNALGAGENLRMYLIHYFTVSGQILSISGVIAFCAGLCAEKKWLRICYLMSVIPMLLAIGLTDSRTAHITVSFGIGMAFAFFLLYRQQNKSKEKPGRSSKQIICRMLLCLMIVSLISFILVATIGKSIQIFNQTVAVKDSDGKADIPGIVAIARADAGVLENASSSVMQEEVQGILSGPKEEDGQENESVEAKAGNNQTRVMNRGFSGDLNTVLTDRPQIWESVILYLWGNPMLLLKGASLYQPMSGVNAMPTMPHSAGHSHNALLQVLLVSGIPGLFLILVFLFQVLRSAWHLFCDQSTSFWKMSVVALVASIWMGEMVECIAQLMFSQRYPNGAILFLSMGLIRALDTGHSAVHDNQRSIPRKDGKDGWNRKRTAFFSRGIESAVAEEWKQFMLDPLPVLLQGIFAPALLSVSVWFVIRLLEPGRDDLNLVYVMTGVMMIAITIEMIRRADRRELGSAWGASYTSAKRAGAYIASFVRPFISVMAAWISLLTVMSVTWTEIGKSILLYPLLMIFLTAFCAGLGKIIYHQGSRTRTAIAMLVAIMCLGIPLLYPESVIPARWLTLYHANPLYQFFFFLKTISLGRVYPNPVTYLYCGLASGGSLLIGFMVDRRGWQRVKKDVNHAE